MLAVNPVRKAGTGQAVPPVSAVGGAQTLSRNTNIDVFSRGVSPEDGLGMQGVTNRAAEGLTLPTNVSALKHRMRMVCINNMV